MALSKAQRRFWPDSNSCEELHYTLFPAVSSRLLERVTDPLIELCVDSVDSILPIINKGRQACKTSSSLKAMQPLVEPWIELLDDSLDAVQIMTGNWKWFYNTYVLGISASTKLLELKICDHPLTRSLRELIEDGGPLCAPLLCLALCGPSAGPLVLANTALGSKLVFIGAAGVMFIGAHVHQQRIAEAPTLVHQVHRRVVYGLVLTGSIYLGLSGLEQIIHYFGIGDLVAAYIANPTLFAYFCKDMLVYPLMLANIQFVAGVNFVDVLPSMILNSVGSSFVAATFTTLLPAGYHTYFTVAALSSMVASSCLMLSFEYRAGKKLGLQNKARTSNAVYSTFVWWMPQLVVLMARTGLADLHDIESVLAVLDVLTKVGVCHITLKSRPSLDNAAVHFGDLRRTDDQRN